MGYWKISTSSNLHHPTSPKFQTFSASKNKNTQLKSPAIFHVVLPNEKKRHVGFSCRFFPCFAKNPSEPGPFLRDFQDPALLADLEQVGFSEAEAKEMIRWGYRWRHCGGTFGFQKATCPGWECSFFNHTWLVGISTIYR